MDKEIKCLFEFSIQVGGRPHQIVVGTEMDKPFFIMWWCHSLLPMSITKSYYPPASCRFVVELGKMHVWGESICNNDKTCQNFSVNEDYTWSIPLKHEQIRRSHPSPSPFLKKVRCLISKAYSWDTHKSLSLSLSLSPNSTRVRCLHGKYLRVYGWQVN